MGMTSLQREAVIGYGWHYYRMPPWRQARHREYPAHLQRQVVAITVSACHCLPQGGGHFLAMLTSALDSVKRGQSHLAFGP